VRAWCDEEGISATSSAQVYVGGGTGRTSTLHATQQREPAGALREVLPAGPASGPKTRAADRIIEAHIEQRPGRLRAAILSHRCRHLDVGIWAIPITFTAKTKSRGHHRMDVRKDLPGWRCQVCVAIDDGSFSLRTRREGTTAPPSPSIPARRIIPRGSENVCSRGARRRARDRPLEDLLRRWRGSDDKGRCSVALGASCTGSPPMMDANSKNTPIEAPAPSLRRQLGSHAKVAPVMTTRSRRVMPAG